MPRFRPYAVYGTTPGPADGHTHAAVVDGEGNGATSVDGSHPHGHTVRRGRVLRTDGHTHKLTGGRSL